MQRFDFKKLNVAEVKKQYHVKISNRFIALENLDDNMDISRTSGKYHREYKNFSPLQVKSA
jgi:hypothetical protein